MGTPATAPARIYGMHERAQHLDFELRLDTAGAGPALPHRHSYFQIQLGLEGASQHAIGAAVRPFGRGCLAFVLPYRVHLVRHPPGTRYWVLNFSAGFLWPHRRIELEAPQDLPLPQYPELIPFVLQERADFLLEPEQLARMQALLADMHGRQASAAPASMVVLRGLLLQLIGIASAHCGPELEQWLVRGPQGVAHPEALGRVMRYVHENLDRPMTLPEAAAVACLSPQYLAHLLKKQTGRTFTQLVTERRLERAKEMLICSGLQVRQVARHCGFADEAYFNRRFRQWVGSTPREFRRQSAMQATGACG